MGWEVPGMGMEEPLFQLPGPTDPPSPVASHSFPIPYISLELWFPHFQWFPAVPSFSLYSLYSLSMDSPGSL